ncbi:MAG: hypothetical protein H8E60_09675 [Candidatus Marinimicrobia bacterium]|nr:hypothetical protein [Candidatus Neomarinimicrobiota bacterium]
MNNCAKCKEFGLEFNREYKPIDFLEGKHSSEIWVVGLNPAQEEGWKDEGRNSETLSRRFDDLEKIPPYFKGFEKVSDSLFEMFGKENGVAHTDLIKCSSKKWPPDSCKGKKADKVINNCKGYLFEQITKFKPKLIICNGAPVSRKIEELLEPKKWLTDTTSYESEINTQRVVVVLSGFIGRIDNFSKRRLGYEIESRIEEIKKT